MKSRKFLCCMSLVLAAGFVAWGGEQSYAAKTTSPQGTVKKITHAQRKAAAARNKKLGLVSKTMTSAAITPLAATAQLAAAAAVVPPPVPLLDGNGFMIPDYFGVANWAFTPPIQKFKDALPQLGPGGANALGQYIPVAQADTTTFANSDYYEIAVVEYEEQLHSDLPKTRLRGYVQLSTAAVPGAHIALTNPNGTPILLPNGTQAYGVDKPHYLGPAIVAQGALKRNGAKPVRIRFFNLLPTGTGGNLFVPVDNTVMGAGNIPGSTTEEYKQNRATVHLHGNDTAWISDGTPHQWITPKGETTSIPKGVSVRNVPDMWFNAAGNIVPAGTAGATNDPGPGSWTIFYSNSQSARLMFYHDHAHGITRLNVYAGEAAAYVLTDQVEQDLIAGTNVSGVNPGNLKVLPGVGIPLVIQDRTFVDPATIPYTDPTWLDPKQLTYGTTPGTAKLGDLWYPHVYMPNQNPWDISGANAFGRWQYGPWFYPPTANLAHGEVPNPYATAAAPWEPPNMPGTPYPSMAGEAFMDTPLVNGTAYPNLVVEPKAYRFRILNACDDRMVNLQLYVASAGIVPSINLTNAGSGYDFEPFVTITGNGHGASAKATVDLDPTSATYGQVTAITMTSVGSGYTAAPTVTIDPPTTGTPATATATNYTTDPKGVGTEVGMVPVSGNGWLPPFDVSGMPDQTKKGPNWVQIGTEGGFLPAPVVIPTKPLSWNNNPQAFNALNVKDHSLLLGSAERADVIVDFSAYAGKTLILYNDAPAAFPAPDPRYDYFTSDTDQSAIGGAPNTLPGFGPNIRTIMRIQVGTTVTTPTPQVTVANLNTVWAKTAAKRGVFEVSQDPIILPQAAYNTAYNSTFPSTAASQFIQVNQANKTFQPIDANGVLQPAITKSLEMKAAHDEMGGVYDTQYGRMSAMLGLELQASTSAIAQFIPYGYASPPVEILDGSVNGTLVGTLNDGTQIWNLSQNGVDTHTIHVHLFNAQLINRISWDGLMLPPDPNELGWKETFRVSGLEQTFIALRPILPTKAEIPFLDKVPNSVRLIDPTMMPGDVLAQPPPAGWFDPAGNSITQILNHYVNFGWEYVYHCHLLAHEEMDMMHATSFVVPPSAPTGLAAAVVGSGTSRKVNLSWTAGSVNATGYTVQRATNVTFTNGLVTIPIVPGPTGLPTTYSDPVGSTTNTYYYRVFATNTVGDTATPGFPTKTDNSGYSNLAAYPLNAPLAAPAAPSNVAARVAKKGTTLSATLTWTDNSNNESGFTIQRATDPNFTANVVTSTVGANVKTITLLNLPDVPYYFRVQAFNSANPSAWVNATPFPTPIL